MFNALSYTKNLEEKGFTRDEAEVLVGMFMQMLEFNMVTKTDFESYKVEIKHHFDLVDKRFEDIYKKFDDVDKRFDDVDKKFDAVDKRFDDAEKKMIYELNKLSLQLTVKLGLMLAMSVGLISTILAIKI